MMMSRNLPTRLLNGAVLTAASTVAKRATTLMGALVATAILAAPAASAAGEPASRVFLNGVPAPVFFNDGDSFRVLGGTHVGSKARLAGFNTLESYGPVHRWGTWTAKELYVLAKMATLNARKGVWHCTSEDLSRDTYGRILWWCEDLAVDQVRKGLAHVMTITAEGGEHSVVAAQQEAIQNKAGMWAHGTPEYVMTSLHSASEGGGRDGNTENRLVATSNGHSMKWRHSVAYGECDDICHMEREFDPADLARLVEAATAAAGDDAKALMAKVGTEEMLTRAKNYLTYGQVGWMDSRDESNLLTDAFAEVSGDVEIKPTKETESSCMIYIDFRRRYGSKRASCLKK